jgi:chromosome segregation ATPase
MVQKYMTNPESLKPCLQYSSDDVLQQRVGIKTEVKKLTGLVKEHRKQKEVLLERYTEGKISRDQYSENCRELDKEIASLESEKEQIITNIPNEIDEEIIDTSLSMYCESVKARIRHCDTFDQKRKLLRDHVNQISFGKDIVVVSGIVPVVNGEILFKCIQNRKH